MNFGELKTAVNTSAGPRDDIPDHIYELVLSEINRDVRITQMLSTSTLNVSTEVTALPADFLEMESAYIIKGDARQSLMPISEGQGNDGAQTGDSQRRYVITDAGIRFLDNPSGAVDIYITYYAKNGELTADTDVNDVLTNYPEMYLYLTLAHVMVWARNLEEAAFHRANYEAIRDRVMKSDVKRRQAGPIRPRSLRVA